VRRLYKPFGIQGLNPFNAGVKSLRATLPAEIFVGILIFKGLTMRRLYKSFGLQELNPFHAGIKSLHATLSAEIYYW
jgi:hypothetical protein